MRQCPKILEDIAYNLIWNWDHKADTFWNRLDPEGWLLTRNPLVVLQNISQEKLDAVLADPEIKTIIADLQEATIACKENKEDWFTQNYPKSELTSLAFFSMEFMLSEALPIYSGGLGNVAGDQLKTMHDLGIPAVGVGLLYQQGYFRQVIDQEGRQQALYPYNSPDQLPIRPLLLPNGEHLRIQLAFPGWTLWLRTWEVQIGKIKLYLLDSNDIANYPPYRAITSELYGGNTELRLQQEIVLGIGGTRLLTALGIEPEVFHLNEGHAAFAILERCHSYMEKKNCSFDDALTATRVGNLFTTHTAVPAGFDLFDENLLKTYLHFYAEKKLKIPFEKLLALGKSNPDDPTERFNMAHLAIRGSGQINGVSLLHEEVSKEIFAPIFPRWPKSEIPIGHVTNGVHVRSWDSAMADKFWTESCGKSCWLKLSEKELMEKIEKTSDEKIWQMRQSARLEMIEFGRYRVTQVLKARGASEEEIQQVRRRFDPKILTLGFARRFATYKRPNMLLHDPERFIRILTNPERPVQLLLAGKAHPADLAGQKLLQAWVQFTERADVHENLVFIRDYNMSITERLVGGVDLWINTPRRPWEACGTSGMKLLVNGGLNLSILDGWWAESYSPEVGWAIGDGQSSESIESQDAKDANALYELLENEVIPAFYERDSRGIPKKWVSKVRKSMGTLTYRFSANRSVQEYLEKYYIPAAASYKKRSKNLSLCQSITKWQEAWKKSEPSIEKLEITSSANEHLFTAQIAFNNLPPHFAQVELFAVGISPILMKLQNNLYTAKVPKTRAASDYTVRIIPHNPDALIPLENSSIVW